MKRLLHITIGLIFITFGVGLIIFGGTLLANSPSWIMGAGFFAFLILGGSIALTGWQIVIGDRILDVLRNLFNNFSSW